MLLAMHELGDQRGRQRLASFVDWVAANNLTSSAITDAGAIVDSRLSCSAIALVRARIRGRGTHLFVAGKQSARSIATPRRTCEFHHVHQTS